MAPAISLGIRLPPCASPVVLGDAASLAEQAGFDSVWLPDSQLLWREAFMSLAIVADRTERVTIGPAVTNFETRHPTVLASAVRTLQDLAPGRVRVAVGTGNSALAGLGFRPSTRARMTEQIGDLRRLLTGGGDAERQPVLRDAHGPAPIFIAANGPNNLEMAGALGDGVILLAGVSDAAVGRALTLVERGAAGSGRQLGDLHVVVTSYCIVTDDVERSARQLKPICLTIAQTGGADMLRDAGIDIEPPARLPYVEPDLLHAADWEHAVEVASGWVSDAAAVRFAEEYCLVGSAADIARRLMAVGELGVDSVLLQHAGSYDLPWQLIDDVATGVVPLLA
ncbi:MAG TPA: LLM class flavin-dependent oxidoreductase [Ilumatobacter sp.]|nr:LLM class flavin-dependent oxidoreductase [Ilumatobacter sp.]